MRRNFFLITAGMIALELCSFFTFRHLTISGWIIGTLVVLLIAAAWQRPWILPVVMLSELLIGGKGYLLSVHWHGTWSVRLVLFITLLGLTALRYRAWRLKFAPRSVYLWSMALLTWVAIGTLWSLFQGIPMARIFFDMNAFLYLPVVPLWWMLMRSTSARQERIYEVLTAGVTVTALLGLVLLGIYHTHTGNLSEVYRWIANTKTGEITFIGSSTYRIFLQSQIYGVLLGLLLVVRPVSAWQRWMWIPLIAGSAAVWTSLSRSFWLGAAAGCITIVVLLVRRAVPWKTVLLRSIGAVAAGFFLFSWANNFPNPLPWAASTNPLTQRNEDIGSEQASEARLNQIRPLLTAILHHPIIGPGFGTEVTYYNPDPRIRGDRTTTAFELGYLDWWLDLGLIGLALLGAWIWSLGRRTMSSPNLQMFLPSLIALSAVHLTTVYFNHPLGIGWLAVLTLFLYDHE